MTTFLLSLIIFSFSRGCVGGEGKNMSLIIAAEQWMPFIRVDVESNGSLTVGGPMGGILEILSEKMRFEYTLVQSPDHYWGVADKNGSYNGMIGQIQREEIDMALGPFIPTLGRALVSGFSFPLWMDSVGILVIRPKLTVDFFSFIKPFGFWVQISVLAFIAIVTIFAKIIATTEANIYQKQEIKMSFVDAAFWTVRMLSQEASHSEAVTKAMQIIFASWLLGSFILMKSYEGILTAMLTVPKVDILINSLEDLVSQNELSWKLETASFMLEYFKASSNPIGRKMYENTNGTIPSCYSARANLARGEFVAICDTISMRKIMHWDFSNHGYCNLYKARDMVLGGIYLTLALPQNSPHRLATDHWIHMMHQTGLVEKWMRDELINATQCLGSPSSDRRSSQSLVLQLNAFYGSFFILAAGYLISFIAFLVELKFKPQDPPTHVSAFRAQETQ